MKHIIALIKPNRFNIFLIMVGLMLFINPILKAQDKAVCQKKVIVKGRDSLPYRIKYPLNFSEEKVYPVELFLHGAGERGNPITARLYTKNTELWVFHGAKDEIVNPLLSIEMVKGIINAGGSPKFTLYGDSNHNSWNAAFA